MDAPTDTPRHHVESTRTSNALAGIPDALHLRCTCGWTSSAHDAADAERITSEHLRSGDPAPAPSTISPD